MYVGDSHLEHALLFLSSFFRAALFVTNAGRYRNPPDGFWPKPQPLLFILRLFGPAYFALIIPISFRWMVLLG